jgi:hypothetical protein
MRMRFFSLWVHCLNCAHCAPLYCHNLDLSVCKKYNRHTDLCRVDENKCGQNARDFLPKNVSGISMELGCM